MMTDQECLEITDRLCQAWSTRDELRANFTDRQQFLDTNLAAIRAEEAATGKTAREVFGYLAIVTTP